MLGSTIKMRAHHEDGVTHIKLLITHPMETGRQTDPATGALKPAHFIQELIVQYQGEVVASAQLGPSIARDPYFALTLRSGRPGETLAVSWRDNLGNSDHASVLIK